PVTAASSAEGRVSGFPGFAVVADPNPVLAVFVRGKAQACELERTQEDVVGRLQVLDQQPGSIPAGIETDSVGSKRDEPLCPELPLDRVVATVLCWSGFGRCRHCARPP